LACVNFKQLIDQKVSDSSSRNVLNIALNMPSLMPSSASQWDSVKITLDDLEFSNIATEIDSTEKES
jgi:AICAR transformylase/IMP cyclohydrolase PurH